MQTCDCNWGRKVVSSGQPWLHNKTLSKNKHANKKPNQKKTTATITDASSFTIWGFSLTQCMPSVTTAKTTKEERHFEMRRPDSRCDYCVAAVAPCPPAGSLVSLPSAWHSAMQGGGLPGPSISWYGLSGAVSDFCCEQSSRALIVIILVPFLPLLC